MNDPLKPLRDQLDAIDAVLLDVIRRRLEICAQVAVVKADRGIQMMQPHRVDAAVSRARTYGKEHGVRPDFLEHLYRTIITETCRLEDEIIATEGVGTDESADDRQL